MQITKLTSNIVTLSVDDVAKMLSAHMKDLTAADARIEHGGQQGRFIIIAFDATRAQVDAVLRPLIPTLPALGVDDKGSPTYPYMIRLRDDGSAIVRWPAA